MTRINIHIKSRNSPKIERDTVLRTSDTADCAHTLVIFWKVRTLIGETDTSLATIRLLTVDDLPTPSWAVECIAIDRESFPGVSTGNEPLM